MKIELPDNRPYGALFAVGNCRSNSAVQEIGSIIVKAGYLLAPSGGADTHVMEPDPDANASKVRVMDEGSIGSDGMSVTREADTAPFKPVPDIVVEKFLADLDKTGAELRVDNTLWLTRVEDINADGVANAADLAGLGPLGIADRSRHLFGYQPRNENPRKSEAGSPPTAPIPDPPKPPDFPLRGTTHLGDIAGYDNRALNFHRRGGGFAASAAVSGALTAGQRITVRKAETEKFSVTLKHPTLTALYRIYCGSGPDTPPYWKRIRLGVMRADTLILRPDLHSAEVIWRAVWRWADEHVDRYRAVRVSEGVI
jgi:hypothetical protein